MGQAASIWVKLGLTDADFVKGLKQSESRLNQFGNRLSGIGTKLTTAFTLPVGIATGFTVKLGAELEQTKIAFEVMTGSAEEAGKMVASFQQMAAKTPFETGDLLQNAKTLMLYGVEAKKVQPILRMLGDVSGGNAEKLGLLTYAFAQIQAQGRLVGQDLRQLVNAGFNPLQVISEKTGQSMLELKEAMEDGEISANQVTQAFIDATSEGGRFFRMMDKQSQTTAGKFSTFKDNLIIALTNLGSALLPAANKLMVALTPITNAVLKLANWFEKLPSPIQDATAYLIVMSVALGPLILGIGKLTSGFSGLIGILRMIPTLKIVSLFDDIGVYIGGAIQGAWSFSTALGALGSAFTPFLIGGAIVGGISALVVLFSRLAENAKMAKIQIAQTSDVQELTKLKKFTEENIARLEKRRSAGASWGGNQWSKQMQDQLVAERQKLKGIETRLDKITTGDEPTTNFNLGDLTPSEEVNGTWESYIAGLKEQKRFADYQKLIDQGRDPGKAIGGDPRTKEMMEDARRQEIASLLQAADAASKFKISTENVSESIGTKLQAKLGAFGDFLANIKTGGMSLFNAGLDLIFEKSQVLAEVFSSLSEGIGVLVDTILGAIKNILGSTGMSAAAGAGAGFLLGGPIGAAIGGVVGLIGGLFGDAAKKQKEAAEAWQNYLQTALPSDLLDKLNEYQKQLNDIKQWMATTPGVNFQPAVFAPWEAKVKELAESAKNALQISVTDLTTNIKNAFSSTSLEEFQRSIYEGTFGSLKNALTDVFLTGPIMQGLLSGLSDSMLNAVMDGVITAEEKTGISLLVDQVSAKSSEFYSILDELGIGMKGLTSSVNQASESILNAPEGFKVQAYRYTATSLSAPTSGEAGNKTVTININGQDAYTTWSLLKPILQANNVIGEGSPANTAPAFAG